MLSKPLAKPLFLPKKSIPPHKWQWHDRKCDNLAVPQHLMTREQSTEYRVQRTENREQRTENREQMKDER